MRISDWSSDVCSSDLPAAVDGVLITIPNGYFEVAEACSGAKFVIAMIAYGTLVANVCYVSWSRRAAFMVMALVVPVLANGLRAFGKIYAAHITSVEQRSEERCVGKGCVRTCRSRRWR